MDYLGFVTRIINYIEEHLYENLNAELFYNSGIELSEFHIYHLFKSIIGMTVVEYVEKRRLSDQMYRWAASNRKWTLVEAAQFSKFDSHRSLIIALRKNFGISPRKYYKKFDGKELCQAFNIHQFKQTLNHKEIKHNVKVIELNQQVFKSNSKRDYEFQIVYNSRFSEDLTYKSLYGNIVSSTSEVDLSIPNQSYLRFKGISNDEAQHQLLQYIYGDYLLTHNTKLKNGTVDMIQKHNRAVKFNKYHEIEVYIPIESSDS